MIAAPDLDTCVLVFELLFGSSRMQTALALYFLAMAQKLQSVLQVNRCWHWQLTGEKSKRAAHLYVGLRVPLTSAPDWRTEGSISKHGKIEMRRNISLSTYLLQVRLAAWKSSGSNRLWLRCCESSEQKSWRSILNHVYYRLHPLRMNLWIVVTLVNFVTKFW
jgi:hypothetical protein